MLYIDLDEQGITEILAGMKHTPGKVNAALARSLKRTSGTFKRQAAQELKAELKLRNGKALRRRLKAIKFTKTSNRFEAGVWFGANDLPVSAFKGRSRKTKTGVSFNGQEFKGAFIARRKSGGKSIFYRKGKSAYPIVECQLPVADKIQVYVEDEVFVRIGLVFNNHFKRDIKARALFGVGKA